MRYLQVVAKRNALTMPASRISGRELHCLENLLLAALEVLEVSEAHVRPLEIPNKDLLEHYPATDAIVLRIQATLECTH
jgi:hypothetical protein